MLINIDSMCVILLSGKISVRLKNFLKLALRMKQIQEKVAIPLWLHL